MTPTSHAAQAGFDLDKLEALARAATPGPWDWWTSNSTLRLTGADGRDGGVLHGYVHSGCGDVSCSTANQAFIAAANPAAVLALISLARNEAQAAPAADERTTLMAPCEGGPILPDSCSDCRREGSTCAIAALAQQAASPAPETAQADDALRKAAIYTEGAWYVPLHMVTSAHAQQDAAPSGYTYREVWVVSSKTFSMLFASEELAKQFISGEAPSMTGGMTISRIPVIGGDKAAAANAGGLPSNDDVFKEVCRQRDSKSRYISTNAVNDVMAAVRKLMPGQSATSAADAKDAERYRVLRDSDYQMLEGDPCVSDECFNTYFGDELDKAVDELKARRVAAIAASQKGGA